MSERVQLTIDNAVATVRMSRPDKLNGLDPEMFDRLIGAGEQIIADRHEDLSLLFADIVGFTQMSSSLQPERVIDLLDDLFRVWLGPYSSNSEVESVIARAIELGFDRPHRIRR